MPTALTKATKDADKVRLFHITHIDNLASIVQFGLLSLNEISARGMEKRSIAFEHLQERRDAIEVPFGEGGSLHDYVPLQFAARPPMLYTIARGGLDTSIKQDDILHLCTSVKCVRDAGLSYAWSNGHPLSMLSSFSDDVPSLPYSLDWPSLLSQQWSSTEDTDRKRKRQAEFLVHHVLPWDLIYGIGVRNSVVAQRVESLLANSSHQPKIAILPEWYYDL